MTSWLYEVQVAGEVGETALARIYAEIGKVHTRTEPVTTVIRGSVPDQSGLVGLLELMHGLGLQVSGLRRVNYDETIDPASSPGHGPEEHPR